MGLFTPIWMKKELNAKQKEKAYGKIRNMDKDSLAEVAKTAPNANIRSYAVEHIEDQQTLAWVAQNSDPYSIRLYAIQKLAKMHYSTDLFYKIALSNCSSKVFGAAFDAINHVIMQTKVEDADTLSDDAVACMIKAMQNSGANCREWPTVSEKIALLLKALYRDGKHCPAIKVLNKRSYMKHTDYHADCSCAQWGHEDVNYIFKLDDNK